MKVTFDIEDLNYLFKALKPALSKDSSKPILQTIQLTCNDGRCQATAMDGYRVHTVSVPCDGDNGVMCVPIVKVPKTTHVIIEDRDEEIIFYFPSETVTVRKVEGEFYDYSHLVEGKSPLLTIGFNPQYMRDAFGSFRGTDVVTVEFFGEVLPCVITRSDTDFRVVLPQKITKLKLKGIR